GMGAGLILEALQRLPLPVTPQPKHGVTYAEKVSKDEARIDWSRPAAEVDAHIRGLSPFPGAWCEIDGERLKLLRSRVSEGGGTPGQILGGLRVACGVGAVQITELQKAGKRATSAEDFLRGTTLPVRLT
ncbi:MAG: methionyl-tRNA formyltransferase, partial [Pseudomonadota bacterium]